MTTIEEMDRMGPKVFSVVMAFACFRYAVGGRDKRYSVDDCVRWLRCMERAAQLKGIPHD